MIIIKKAKTTIANMLNDHSGATAIEYTLIAAFVAVAMAVGAAAVGGALGLIYEDIDETASGAIDAQLENK